MMEGKEDGREEAVRPDGRECRDEEGMGRGS